MLTPLQTYAAKAIVNIFETGTAEGRYGEATVLPDGAGISYGRSQATDGGGNLDYIVTRYLDRGGRFAAQLAPYVDELQADATTRVDSHAPPAWVRDLLAVLRRAGDEDPVMRAVQDEVFDERYWNPALAQSASAGLTLPLSHAVVYDTCIQSGPGRVITMRNLFVEPAPARGGDERAWTRAYVAARRAWLASFVSSKGPEHERAVRSTVYRMDAFRALIDEGAWMLDLPMTVRGQRIEAPSGLGAVIGAAMTGGAGALGGGVP